MGHRSKFTRRFSHIMILKYIIKKIFSLKIGQYNIFRILSSDAAQKACMSQKCFSFSAEK